MRAFSHGVRAPSPISIANVQVLLRRFPTFIFSSPRFVYLPAPVCEPFFLCFFLLLLFSNEASKWPKLWRFCGNLEEKSNKELLHLKIAVFQSAFPNNHITSLSLLNESMHACPVPLQILEPHTHALPDCLCHFLLELYKHCGQIILWIYSELAAAPVTALILADFTYAGRTEFGGPLFDVGHKIYFIHELNLKHLFPDTGLGVENH